MQRNTCSSLISVIGTFCKWINFILFLQLYWREKWGRDNPVLFPLLESETDHDWSNCYVSESGGPESVAGRYAVCGTPHQFTNSHHLPMMQAFQSSLLGWLWPWRCYLWPCLGLISFAFVLLIEQYKPICHDISCCAYLSALHIYISRLPLLAYVASLLGFLSLVTWSVLLRIKCRIMPFAKEKSLQMFLLYKTSLSAVVVVAERNDSSTSLHQYKWSMDSVFISIWESRGVFLILISLLCCWSLYA